MSNIPNHLYNYTIKRTIFKCGKYSLNLYLPPVETIYSSNNYQVNPNAILYLTLPWPKSNESGTDGRSFAIRNWNRRKVLRKLNEAIEWFTKYTDLYVEDKDKRLFFNTKYNDLSSKYAPKYFENPQAFKIVPIALEYANGMFQEGIRFYMNKLENFMELTVEELQELFDLIYDFDFAGEIQISYQALLLSFNTKNMVSAEELKNRFTPT